MGGSREGVFFRSTLPPMEIGPHIVRNDGCKLKKSSHSLGDKVRCRLIDVELVESFPETSLPKQIFVCC